MIDHAEYRARRTFGSLDALRAFSIVAVIWHHTAAHPDFEPSTRGFLGVDLFFVLSGFLIVTLILRERDTTGTISLRDFYIRRSLRIFPIYYLLLGAFALAFWVKPGANAEPYFQALPYYLTYTANWTHIATIMSVAWSLAAEEQFYLVWPPIERYLRKLWLPVLVVLLVINQLINFGLIWESLGDLEILQVTFTPILLGVLLAHVLHDPRGYRIMGRVLGSRGASLVTFVLVIGLSTAIPGDVSGLPRLLIHLAMVALVASVVIREDHLLTPLMRTRPLLSIGMVSYGMYLYHTVVRHVVFEVFGEAIPSLFLKFVLTTALTWVIAKLSFHLIEKRFLALKHRFAAKTHAT